MHTHTHTYNVRNQCMSVLLSVVSVSTCTLVQCIVHVCIVQAHKCSLSHTHLLHTDPTLSRMILKRSIHSGDLDFVKYLVNKLSVDVNGELNDIHYLYSNMHTHTQKHNTHTHTHTHMPTVVVRPWESGVRCMAECHFPTV